MGRGKPMMTSLSEGSTAQSVAKAGVEETVRVSDILRLVFLPHNNLNPDLSWVDNKYEIG